MEQMLLDSCIVVYALQRLFSAVVFNLAKRIATICGTSEAILLRYLEPVSRSKQGGLGFVLHEAAKILYPLVCHSNLNNQLILITDRCAQNFQNPQSQENCAAKPMCPTHFDPAIWELHFLRNAERMFQSSQVLCVKAKSVLPGSFGDRQGSTT